LDTIVELLATGRAFGVELGMQERLIPGTLGAGDPASVPKGMTLRRYLGVLEVTTLHGVVVMIQLTLIDGVAPASLEVIGDTLRRLGVQARLEWESMEDESEGPVGRLTTNRRSSVVVDGPRTSVSARL
jgi:hypothetical protein